MKKSNFLLCIALLLSFPNEIHGQNEVEVVGGFDGANPQSQDAISRESTNRFRIKPFNEEGSSDSYYFRFNTKVINHSSETRDVEFIIEWPALQNHPKYPYSAYYYGDIGNWKWTYGNRDGITERIHIPVEPGVTYVGFYPRYSYEQFEMFMNGLTHDNELEKWVEGKSFYGRNIWGVKITNPEISDINKDTILITARNHPYETSGSYIVEEMIKYLLSDNPQANKLKKEYCIYFIPMMNPDGVALGCNQRTRTNGVNMSYGVGTDDPAVTTLLSFVTKIHPTLWTDVHSWPHQGDDGMWATHKWIAENLVSQIPNKTLHGYIWNVSFVSERKTSDDHLWQWLIRTHDSGGCSLSISWFRRNEEDMRKIGVLLIDAIGAVVREQK